MLLPDTQSPSRPGFSQGAATPPRLRRSLDRQVKLQLTLVEELADYKVDSRESTGGKAE